MSKKAINVQPSTKKYFDLFVDELKEICHWVPVKVNQDTSINLLLELASQAKEKFKLRVQQIIKQGFILTPDGRKAIFTYHGPKENN